MKRFARALHAGARQAWLWRHRHAFAEPSAAAPRLLVDVSAIMRHDAQTGIQRVVRAVWSELWCRNGFGFEVIPVFASSKHGYCYAPAEFLERRTLVRLQEPVRVRAGDKFLGLDLSAHLLPKYRRQLRAWRAHGATVHLIVYDLLPLQRPAWFTRAAVTNFRKWLGVVTQEVDQAICISDYVAHGLVHWLEQPRMRRPVAVGRLKMGGDIAGSVPSRGLPHNLQYKLDHIRSRPTILMVGTIEPRKGYDAALAAFEHLWRSRSSEAPDLVIVGRGGWRTEKLQAKIRSHSDFGYRLHWFDQMSDEGLCVLYDACRGVLMASRGEGWGLPVVEAAMHRRYVLARDLPVFREHGQGNILYFTDDAPEALGERVMQLTAIGQNPAPASSLPTWSGCVDGLINTVGLAQFEDMPAESLLRKAS